MELSGTLAKLFLKSIALKKISYMNYYLILEINLKYSKNQERLSLFYQKYAGSSLFYCEGQDVEQT